MAKRKREYTRKDIVVAQPTQMMIKKSLFLLNFVIYANLLKLQKIAMIEKVKDLK